MIRQAVITDIGGIHQLCKEAWSTSYHGHLELCEAKTLDLIRRYLRSEATFVWVSEIDGEIAGIMAGYTTKLEMSQCSSAGDQMFYMSENVSRGTLDARRLVKKFIEWAKNEQNVDMINMTAAHGSDRGEKAGLLLESVGLTKSGSVYYWVKD